MTSEGKKVLAIIEDDVILAKALDSVLTKAGYEVKITYNGDEAEAAIMKDKPDCILLDIILPGKNGFDLLKGFQNKDETKNIPVVILSNLGQDAEVEKGISMGAKDYIIKSNIDIYEVPKVIEKYI